MRVAVYGAGGVGGLLGGRLQAGGHDVSFIARGHNLAALQATGLTISSPQGDLLLPKVHATDDPASLGPVDLVLLGVKLYDLEAAARAIKPLLGTHSMVLPVQNGVDTADRLMTVLGTGPLLKGCIYVVSFLTAPGRVEHKSPFCRLVFAEFDHQPSPRCTNLAAALQACGLEASVSANIEVDLWRKFLMLAPFAAVACLTRGTVGQILANPTTRSLLADAAAEVAAVARAKGIALPTDIVAMSMTAMASFPADSRPSMQADIDAGRRLELDSLSGAVRRFGAALGVPTPVHDVAYRALCLHNRP